MAGFNIVEKAERLPLYVSKKFFTHIGFNIDAELVSEKADDLLQESAEQEYGQQKNTYGNDSAPFTARQ